MISESTETRHVVMFSGGIGSWATAKIVANRYGADNLILLFSDVKGQTENPHVGEDQDTYRFIKDAAANVGGELVVVADGRDIWQVFKDKRFLGNSRMANCSHELKQKPARQWLDSNCDPENTIVYVGIDWTETHRVAAIKKNYQPFTSEAPLTDPPYLTKQDMIEWAEREALAPPRLYSMGFAHNNCGGGCVRAGQGQFKHLLDVMPERFAEWETREIEMRDWLGKNVSILTETVLGVKRPLLLTELRSRAEAAPTLIDISDIGGCGCFLQELDEEGK